MATVGAMLKAESGIDLEVVKMMPYLDGADPADPLVFPSVSDEVMSKFPPAMLASSSRDWLMSSVTACHRQLCRVGVPAELHIWDGLGHYFHSNPMLPESIELHQITVKFFERYLGQDR